MKIEFFSKNEKWIYGKKYIIFEKPICKAIYKNGILYVCNRKIKTKKPFTFIENFVKKYRFFAAGFVSYDFKKYIYPEKIKKKSDIGLPYIYVAFFKNFKENLSEGRFFDSKVTDIKFPDKDRFLFAVKKAKEYIREGDIYQVNLSHRIEINGFFNTDKIFKNLIRYQPTPYMMHIKEEGFSLISGSMELFLEKKKNHITTKPIKGTRPTGKTVEDREKNRKELFLSEKERAENLMITDLMRNDLGRICERGSIKVEKLFDIEEYKSLFQMVSTVTGKLKEEINLQKIIENTFPPGSVTGAPKKRAIEIIDMLEEHRRSVYCGATFLIKPDMDFVMSVAIRQSIFQKNKCYIYVGSGIVADSQPEKEYEETILKAKANLKAMGLELDIF